MSRPKPLLPEHGPLVEELLAKFSPEEIRDLARRLPFDERAARAVHPNLDLVGHHHSEAAFRKWLDLPRGSPERLSVYVAAAAYCAVGKRLLQLKKMKEAEVAFLNELSSLLTLVKDRGAELLRRAMKGPEAKEGTDGSRSA